MRITNVFLLPIHQIDVSANARPCRSRREVTRRRRPQKVCVWFSLTAYFGSGSSNPHKEIFFGSAPYDRRTLLCPEM